MTRTHISSFSQVPGLVLAPQDVTTPLLPEFTTCRTSAKKSEVGPGTPGQLPTCCVTCSKSTSLLYLLITPAPGPLHILYSPSVMFSPPASN